LGSGGKRGSEIQTSKEERGSHVTPSLLYGACYGGLVLWAVAAVMPGQPIGITDKISQVCETPVEVRDSTGIRLECVEGGRFRQCGEILAGDALVVSERSCRVVEAGMGGAFRLASGLSLDINRATVEHLQLLDGVGSVLAQAVIAHRLLAGPFESLDELLEVRGVGPGMLRRIGRFLTVGADKSR